jgi:hypothetical protein
MNGESSHFPLVSFLLVFGLEETATLLPLYLYVTNTESASYSRFTCWGICMAVTGYDFTARPASCHSYSSMVHTASVVLRHSRYHLFTLFSSPSRIESSPVSPSTITLFLSHPLSLRILPASAASPPSYPPEPPSTLIT